MRRSTYFTTAAIVKILLLSLLLSACKTKPLSQEDVFRDGASPIKASLVFERVEAKDPVFLTLYFTLEIDNRHPSTGHVNIESWQVELNGMTADSGFSLEFQADGVFPRTARTSFPVKLNMDANALASASPVDNYKINLITELTFTFDTAPQEGFKVSSIAEFPGVQAPIFDITAIAILKAELINTRFRVSLKIDNPNPFPVTLSALNYELYGNGRLWADGSERNRFTVPGRSHTETNLFLSMNFINMDRALLEQIIRLEDVNYRFVGNAVVGTGVAYLPVFSTGFNLSGYSVVLEK